MRASGALLALCLAGAGAAIAAAAPRYDLGRPASAAEIAGWDIDVRGDGAGLPPGQGSVEEGRVLYAAKCAGCHGAAGEGGLADPLAGGVGTLASAKPVRTVGSYWPFAPTVFDYVRRAMPFNAPQSLTADQTYAVVAYVLFLNRLVPADALMNARSLPRVRMPNRDGFIRRDPRPDVP
jgi:cytochrome c